VQSNSSILWSLAYGQVCCRCSSLQPRCAWLGDVGARGLGFLGVLRSRSQKDS